MAKLSNPFTVLGLSNDNLRTLKPEQLDEVIFSAYRTLSKIHHPDVGGSNKKFKKLSWAISQLNRNKDPVTFNYWKDKFFHNTNTKLKELSAEFDKVVTAIDNDLALRLDWFQAITAPAREPLFAIRNKIMLVRDVVVCALLSKTHINTSEAFSSKSSNSSPLIDLRIVVDGHGNLTQYLTQNINELKGFSLAPWSLLGVIPRETNLKGEVPPVSKLIQEGAISRSNPVQGCNFEDFKKIVPYISPYYNINDLIICFCAKPAPRFRILGRLSRIQNLNANKHKNSEVVIADIKQIDDNTKENVT